VKGKTQGRPAEGPPDVMQDGFLEMSKDWRSFQTEIDETKEYWITPAGMKLKSRRALLCRSLPTCL